MGWRGIGRIHQRKTHLISGQLEWWRASNKIQIYYFNFVMLLTVSESETSGFLFWGPSSEMEDKAYPPWLHQNSNLVLAEDLASCWGFAKAICSCPPSSWHFWTQVGQVKPTLPLLGKCCFSRWRQQAWWWLSPQFIPGIGCLIRSLACLQACLSPHVWSCVFFVVCNKWENYLRRLSSLCFHSSWLHTFLQKVT